MKSLLSIVGPTGVGKTDFAVSCASEIHGALLSADSRQVYKGLDIISGKDKPQASRFKSTESQRVKDLGQYSFGYYEFANGVPVHLLDLVEPTYSFSVQDFVTCFETVLPVVEKEYTPILVGGTGFYVESLFRPIETLSIPPNSVLRKELEMCSVEDLQEKLRQVDKSKFNGMNNSDAHNKRRLIRAIEVAVYYSSSGEKRSREVPSKNAVSSRISRTISDYNMLKIGLTAPRDEIKKRISARVEKRIQHGALQEAEALFQDYEHLSSGVKTANGYKQLFSYLSGELNFHDAVDAWRRSEFVNAKKQMTWFPRDPEIYWFDVTDPQQLSSAHELVLNWYNRQ